MKNEQPKYLDETIRLLKEGTCHKRLQDGSEHAVEVLREAEKLLQKCDLPNPWPQLVSYRLANALFRHAQTTEELEEIDELLSGAALEGCLGPMPRLQRLAVLARLGKTPEQMRPVFNKLVQQIGDYSRHEVCEVEAEDKLLHLTSLQNNYFNMLELVTYFSGYPYDGLDGQGLLDLGMRTKALPNRDPFADLYNNMEEWRLVGTISGLATTAYPGKIALRELEARMENEEICPPCIAFKISSDRDAHHHWNFNLSKNTSGDFIWIRVPPNANHIRFLASILYYKHARNRGGLLQQICNDDSLDSDSVFRTQKRRCAEKISEELNKAEGNLSLDKSKIFFHDKSINSPVPELHGKISVLGAYEIGH